MKHIINFSRLPRLYKKFILITHNADEIVGKDTVEKLINMTNKKSKK